MDMSSDDNFVSNLGRTFSESLHIQDAQKSVHVPQGNDICSESEENLCGAINKQETSVNMMCLKKSATFPTPNTILPSSSSDEEANTAVTDSLSGDFAHQTYSRSISLPVSS